MKKIKKLVNGLIVPRRTANATASGDLTVRPDSQTEATKEIWIQIGQHLALREPAASTVGLRPAPLCLLESL